MFSATMRFISLQDGFFGQKIARVKSSNGEVVCYGGGELSAVAIDLGDGDTVTVRGTIDDTILGSLTLNPCRMIKGY